MRLWRFHVPLVRNEALAEKNKGGKIGCEDKRPAVRPTEWHGTGGECVVVQYKDLVQYPHAPS